MRDAADTLFVLDSLEPRILLSAQGQDALATSLQAVPNLVVRLQESPANLHQQLPLVGNPADIAYDPAAALDGIFGDLDPLPSDTSLADALNAKPGVEASASKDAAGIDVLDVRVRQSFASTTPVAIQPDASGETEVSADGDVTVTGEWDLRLRLKVTEGGADPRVGLDPAGSGMTVAISAESGGALTGELNGDAFTSDPGAAELSAVFDVHFLSADGDGMLWLDGMDAVPLEKLAMTYLEGHAMMTLRLIDTLDSANGPPAEAVISWSDLSASNAFSLEYALSNDAPLSEELSPEAETRVWTAATGGDWHTPDNWQDNIVPSAGEEVSIATPGITITLASPVSIAALDCDANLRIESGSLTVTGAGEIRGDLFMAAGTTLTADGTGASLLAAGRVSIQGANLYALNGGHLSLPGVVNYFHASTANSQTRVFRAEGAGSRLELDGLVTITNGTHYEARINIQAHSGGVVDLSALEQIVDPNLGDSRRRAVHVSADGADSRVELASLLNFIDVNGTGTTDGRYSTLAATNGGVLQTDRLAILQGVEIALDGTGTLPVASISRWVHGRLLVGAGTHAFTSLTDLSQTHVQVTGGAVVMDTAADINGASFTVSGGVTLALPSAVAYYHASSANDQTRTFRAEGEGSVLDLSNLTAIVNGDRYNSDINIEALSGGTVDLRGVTEIRDTDFGDTRVSRVRVYADGADSLVNLAALVHFHDSNGDELSALAAVNGGEARVPNLVDCRAVSLTLNGTGTLPVAQLVTFASGALSLSGAGAAFPNLAHGGGTAFTVDGVHADLGAVTYLGGASVTLRNGGTADLSSAADIHGASFLVSGGVTLALPAAGVYYHASSASNQTRTFRAEGEGSVLDLANLTAIVNGDHYNSDINIEALSGGTVDLRGVTEIRDTDFGDTRVSRVRVYADGADSLVNLAALVHFHDQNGDELSTLGAVNGGEARVPNLVDCRTVSLTLNGTGTLPVAQLVTFASGALSISGTDYAFPNLVQAGGTALTVDGVHADLGAVTYLGGASVTLRNGGTADLSRAADIHGASFLVSGGVTLALPAAGVYYHASTASNQARTFRADGAGSVLDLANLTAIVNGDHYNSDINIEALSGGTVDLRGVTEIRDTDFGDTRVSRVRVAASGADSRIDLSSLANFHDVNGDELSMLQETSDGTITVDAPAVSFLNVSVTLASAPTAYTLPAAEDPVDGDNGIQASGASYTTEGPAAAGFPEDIASTGGGFGTATVEWVGGSGDWGTAANWSSGVVPGPSDNVVIDRPGEELTITLSSGSRQVNALHCEENLSITGGSLTVTDGSVVNGAFLMSAGTSLQAYGDYASFAATAVTTIDGANLYAWCGGSILLPNAVSYAHASTANNQTRVLRAHGSGSVLDVSGLTAIVNGNHYNADLSIEALAGAVVDLGGVTEIRDTESGDTRVSRVVAYADGAGSVLDFSALTTFTDHNTDEYSALYAVNGGEILAPNLTGLQAVSLTLNGTGTLPVAQITRLASCSVTVSGADAAFASLTDAYGTSFTVTRVSVDLGGLTTLQRGALWLHGGATAEVGALTNIDGASLYVYDGDRVVASNCPPYSR